MRQESPPAEHSTPPGAAAISCWALTKRYGRRTAVDSLNLHVPRGTTFGLLGPNGVGKTTAILMMLGLVRPSEGHASVESRVSCPDWSNPCKHLAAVYYLLAEELDRDPMLLLRLRGIERDELVALLDLNTTATATATTTAAAVAGDTPPRNARDAVAAAPARPAMPLPAEPEQFWCAAEAIDIGDLRVPVETAPLVRRMGSFPLWRGAQPFAQALQSWYERASAAGCRAGTRHTNSRRWARRRLSER